MGMVAADPSCCSLEPPKLKCFSEEAHDAIFHFQILRLQQQLYIWIGCNSARLGNVLASIPTPYDKMPSLAELIGGGAGATGGSIARRLALKTGWSIILSSNVPPNTPTLEAYAEKRLFQELKDLGCMKS